MHPSDSGFTAPIDISDPRYPARNLNLAVSTAVTAAWTCYDGRYQRVQVASFGEVAGQPVWCGRPDHRPPKANVSGPRYPVRWLASRKPVLKASCHEQCKMTAGLLLFSKGHRAAKVGLAEQVFKPNRRARIRFPKTASSTLRLIRRAVRRRSNNRIVYRLRFDDLAGNSRLITKRVRLRL
jgi:hypothetical protein